MTNRTPSDTHAPCKGMNCGITRYDQEHSIECQAEHLAAIAGGRFVQGPSMTTTNEQSSREQEREAIERASIACRGHYGTSWTEINVGVVCELIALAEEALANRSTLAVTTEEAGREGEAHVPYLCIAPVCGGHCGDCAYAIGPQEQRDYALRYAHLRTMQQSGCGVFEFQGNGEPNPNGILLGGHLDSFVDAELSAMKLPPAPAQSGGQGND